MTIYTTKEWKGFGRQNYYCNEYRLEGGKVVKYEQVEASWTIDDPAMPDWLKQYLP